MYEVASAAEQSRAEDREKGWEEGGRCDETQLA